MNTEKLKVGIKVLIDHGMYIMHIAPVYLHNPITNCNCTNKVNFMTEKEIMKHLSKLRHQVVKFKKLLKDIKSTTKCKW